MMLSLRRTLVRFVPYSTIHSLIFVLMKGFRIILFFCVCTFQNIINCCKAQDSLLIHYLLERITQQQSNTDNLFINGIYPSYISKQEKFATKKKDNNIFFNGLIAYTLAEIKNDVDNPSKQMID